MSLFIKGAKLPKIEGDKAIKAEIRCVGGKWEFGIMTGGYYCSQEWTFYPLSELPPHGKLGDLDALINKIGENVDKAKDRSYDWWYACTVAYDFALAAPTIIPAEEGET